MAVCIKLSLLMSLINLDFSTLQLVVLQLVLKKIEKDMGRADGIRYGPRPIDLDILLYGRYKISSDCLIVPHERIWERPFVMAPLVDLLGSDEDSDVDACWHSLSIHPGGIFESWEKLGGQPLIGKNGMKRVLPVGNCLWDWSLKTSVTGILNVTPDSFSDGGKYQSVEDAVSQARLMLLQGADIIDIGAQSTRLMASKISPEEEMDRLIPVLEAILNLPEAEGKLLSVDTFYSQVASEAVSKGAHLVNDVSVGQLDSKMFDVVAKLKVPYIAMHMRGSRFELYMWARDAELAGIASWRIIIDPGIGFSKKTEHNLNTLMGLRTVQKEITRKSLAVSHSSILIGPFRKRFLGDICSRPASGDRDPATVASVTTTVLEGANIGRVHNVKDNVDAVKLCDAMLKRTSFT
ncbi:hypothetical protein AgCh_017944 [Apium graveolens]